MNPTLALQQHIWGGQLPLSISLAPSECRTFDQTEPYLIFCPRLAYLPFLLPRLLAFFAPVLIQQPEGPHTGWFSFEGVPLKWHYPVGLLYDLYAGAEPAEAAGDNDGGGKSRDEGIGSRGNDDETEAVGPLPWRLELHFSDWPSETLIRLDADGRVVHDAFVNSVKEADFLRNGTARAIMSLSRDDSFGLWEAVQKHDLTRFRSISALFMPAPAESFRHIPLRIFLPSTPDAGIPAFKALQHPFPPVVTSASASLSSHGQGQGQSQTLGTALHALLPTLFPSRRVPVHARPVLHGAVVPMAAPLEELARGAAYADGWVGVVVAVM